MKTKVYFGISIRLILLFSAAMAISFVTPLMREFFGDVKHVHIAECAKCYSGCIISHEPDNLWEWGTRHYWYVGLMICLFILSLINFIASVINIVKKNYDTENW